MTILKHGSLLVKKNTEQISTIKNLLFDDPQLQFIEPLDATRKIRVPTIVDYDTEGLIFWIVNTSLNYALLIHTSLEEEDVYITTINPNDIGILVCDNNKWIGSISSSGGADVLQTQIFS